VEGQSVYDPREHGGYRGGHVAWAKFAIGILLLAGTIFVLGQGYTPPGPAGEVFRNSLLRGIDATPLFYTEVESLMPADQSGRR
jgi:hypothetical protein